MHVQANIRYDIYLLVKYIKSVLLGVAKRLSYLEDARCLNVKRVPPFCVTQLCEETVLHYVGNERLGSMYRKPAHCSFVIYVSMTVCSVDEILHHFRFSFFMWALRDDTFRLRCATERVIELLCSSRGNFGL